jgi:hypothetical protein
MATYRTTRAIEASVIDFLKQAFAAEGGWNNITVEKTFKNVYAYMVLDPNKMKPAVCVRVLNNKVPRIELGTNKYWRTALVMIDIFGTSDGQREDLADFIVSKIIKGVPFYKYTIKGDEILSKVQVGRLRMTVDGDVPVNFNIDKSALAVMDRYRNALSLSATMSNIEE